MTPDGTAAALTVTAGEPCRDGAPRLGPLLAGTAMLALALGAGMARGQSFIGNGVAFQGTASTALGNVSLANGNSAGGPTDTLTVHTPTAIIDWQPYDDANNGQPAIFLPGGSTAIFQNGGEVSGFTVLNRINPGETTKPIEFDGHVISQLIDDSGNATRGGNVWFQAPGGIIVGSSGVFDVGSLILTPNVIDTAGDTALPDPATGLRFTGAAGSVAGVTLQPGAQINQPAPGSYLAIVAPRIDQGGTVTTNGSVGYVAAEAANITINAGLFDISSAIGSTVAAGGETTLSHTGTTTGPAEASSAAPHVVYMIAVPANDAVTLLASGTAGYQAAADATQVNGSVVLGAGVAFAGNPEGLGAESGYPGIGSGVPANITIPAGTFTSAVNAQATGAISVATTAGDIAFAGFLGQTAAAATLHVIGEHRISSSGQLDIESFQPDATAALTMQVDAGGTLDVATLLQGVRRGADGQPLTFGVDGTVTAGSLVLTTSRVLGGGDATGGTTRLDVAGSLTADSVALGAIGQTGEGNATGGIARIDLTGRLTTGDLLLAAGTQPIATASAQTGGTAQGGTAQVDVGTGAMMSISGTATLDASANAPGATSTIGGTARLSALGGTIMSIGTDTTTTLNAGATGGSAQGGTALLATQDGGTVTVAGGLGLVASGANTGGASGAAVGGVAQLSAIGGTLTVGGVTTLDARGIATAVSDASAPGTGAVGGAATITVAGSEGGDTPGRATFGGLLTLDASALADQGTAAATGNATGGTATVTANTLGTVAANGSLLLDSSANANSVGSDRGIVATGGQSTVGAVGGAITLAGFAGGNGPEIASDAQGGTATGGTALVRSSGGGSVTSTSPVRIHASGYGGSLADGSIAGFDGTGGSAAVDAADGTVSIITTRIDASGAGGNSAAFEGGAGTGGTASITTSDPAGRITIGTASLDANGSAGAGATGTAIGRGGTASVVATGGLIRFDDGSGGGSFAAGAYGAGSNGSSAGRDPATSGIGYGGTVRLVADQGGDIAAVRDIVLSPYAYGGGFASADAAASAGGAGIGGSATVSASNGGGRPGTISFRGLTIDNETFGGDGGTGGAAIGGANTIQIASGASITGTTLTAQSYTAGGRGESDGGVGGTATGGGTTLTVDGGTLAIAGDADGQAISVGASAIGGDMLADGTGGAANGSTATVTVNAGTLDAPVLSVTTSDIGGIGGSTATTAGGIGGAAGGGTAMLTVAGGTVTTASLQVQSAAVGGAGGSGNGFISDLVGPSAAAAVQNGLAGGTGGAASGGTATVAVSGGTLAATGLAIAAATAGGDGGRGGDGTGSDASGTATGGVGGNGGDGALGSARLSVTGGTATATTTEVSSTDNGGNGGAGGFGAPDPTIGAQVQAANGIAGNGRGGAATIESDLTGSASLGATALRAGGTIGTTIEAGTITLAARDSAGTAPATPLMLASLTATMDANTSADGDRIQVTAAAPIAVAGDATVSGPTLTRFDMTGRGTLAVGGALGVDATEVIGTQAGAPAGTIAITAGSARIAATSAGVTLATLTTTGGDLGLTAAQRLTATDLVSAGNAALRSGGDTGFTSLTAARDIDIESGGALAGTALASQHGAIDATAAGSATIATVAAGGEIEIVAGGAAHYGTVAAGTDPASAENDGGGNFGSVALIAQGGDVVVDTGVSAYRSIGLVATGALSAPSLVAANGGSVGTVAGGQITLGSVTAPDLFYVGGLGAIAALDPDASATAIVAALRAAGPVASGGGVSIAGATAGQAIVSAGGDLAIAGALVTSGDATLRAGGALSAATVAAGDKATLTGTLTANAGTIAIGTASSGLDTTLAAGSGVQLTSLDAGRDGDIRVGALPGAVTIGSVTIGDDVRVVTPGAVSIDTLVITGLANGTPSGGPAFPGNSFVVTAGGDIRVGSASTALGSVTARSSGGAIAFGTLATGADSVNSDGAVSLTAAGPVSVTALAAVGPVTATGSSVSLTSTGSAALRIATVTASAGDVSIDAGGDLIASGAITSTTGDVALAAGGAVDLASLSAGDSATVVAGTTLHAGSIAVGTNAASPANDGTGSFGSVGLIAGGAITVDTPLVATGSIGLVSRTAGLAFDSLTAGANGSVAVLAGGDIRLGTVTAPNLLYVGGPAAIASLGDDPSVTDIVATLGRAGAVASGGSVTIGQARSGAATIAAGTTLILGGPLVATAGGVTLVSTGDLVAHDVTASGAISAKSAGGALTIGAVTAGQPTIAGGIRLAAMQAVTGGALSASGSVAVSSSAAGLRLGDVTSSGGGVSATAGGGDIALGTVRAAGSIGIGGTGRITAGDLTAGTGPLLPGEGGGGATDPATDGIAAGFDGATIERCDDCYTDGIALPFTLNYFGQSYSTTYVSNNGYLTFNNGQGEFTPGGLGSGYSGLPIIAAFFADVDTRNGLSAQATYGSGTFAGRQAFGATWNGVGYYASQADKLNNFQIVLTNRADTGAGNFDIYYNYTNVAWETGSASGGINGFGGTSAAVGYNAGTGNQAGTFFELPGSRVPGSFINGGTAPLIAGTNDGIAGQLLFTVRNGQVSAAAAESPSIHVSNLGGSTPADIRLGNLSAEGAEVHGSGRVTVGNVSVGDRGSGVAAVGQPFATVLDAGLGLSAGNVSGTGLIVLGSRTGDVSAGTIAGGASVMALADGSVALDQVTTGTAATDTLYVGGAATDALTGFGLTTLLSGRSFDPATLATVTPAAAGGTIAISGPIATGNLRAAATGAVTVRDVRAAGAIGIAGGAGLTTGALNAGTAIDLASAAGAIATGALATIGPITVVGANDVALGAVSTGTIAATSSGGGLTIGATTATDAVTLAAAGTLGLGAIDAARITLSSADIAIDPDAALGSSRTASVRFVNTGAGRTSIGDATGAVAGDYALSATELAGVHAAAIGVTTQARDGGTPDTLIGALTLRGAALSNANLLGRGAGLTVASPGAIRIVGAARFTGLAGGDTVTLRSTASDITGVLPAGSIALDDGSGALAGTLALGARRILFATPAAASAIASATTPAAIDAALSDSGGLANPAGYLRADTVSLRFADALYTQNSGASSAIADRAGITAGAGGLLLAPTTTMAGLVLNGRIEQGGTTRTGTQVVDALALSPRGYGAGATVNSCLLDGSNCAAVTPPQTDPISAAQQAVTGLVQLIQPVQDVVAQVRLGSALGNNAIYSFATPALISSLDLVPPAIDPQIDEPVTGAGNESLWVNIGVGRELAPMGGKPDGVPQP